MARGQINEWGYRCPGTSQAELAKHGGVRLTEQPALLAGRHTRLPVHPLSTCTRWKALMFQRKAPQHDISFNQQPFSGAQSQARNKSDICTHHGATSVVTNTTFSCASELIDAGSLARVRLTSGLPGVRAPVVGLRSGRVVPSSGRRTQRSIGASGLEAYHHGVKPVRGAPQRLVHILPLSCV